MLYEFSDFVNKFSHDVVGRMRSDGVGKTLVWLTKVPGALWRRRKMEQELFSLASIEQRFTEIYRKNHWRSEESVSGYGSTLAYTENLRKELPALFERFSIRSVLDAPCGDFNWMRHVLEAHPLDYTGGEIVLPLVQSLNEKYRNERTRFIHLDLTTGTFPKADLMICRDCLFHLSYEDTRRVLKNFVASEIPYLLTTTHVDRARFKNRDIKTGGYRMIDLFSPPYQLPRDVAFRVDDWLAPDTEREMCLWTRTQVAEALTKFV